MDNLALASKKKTDWSQFLSLGLMFLLMFADRFVNQSLFALMPFVEECFTLSAAKVGSYSTLYMLGALIFTLFSGRLIDTVGTKAMLYISLLVMGGFILLQSFSPTYRLILITGLVIGASHSIILPSVTKTVRLIYDVQHRATYQSLVMTGFDLGGALAGIVLPWIAILMISWRSALVFTASLPVVIAVVVYFSRMWQQSHEPLADNTYRQSVKSLLSLRGLPFVTINAFAAGGLITSTMAHFTLFVYKEYQLTPKLAGLLMALIFFGGIPGRIVIGWFCDKYFRYERRKVLAMTLFFAGMLYVALMIAAFLKIPIALLFGVSFMLGFFTFGGNPIQALLVVEMVKENQAATASALVSSVPFSLGKAIAPLVFGIIVDSAGGSYWLGWLFLSLLSFLGCVVCFGIPSTARSKNSNILSTRSGIDTL